MALPEDALATDASEFIGYLVWQLDHNTLSQMLTTTSAMRDRGQRWLVRCVAGRPHDELAPHHGLAA